MTKALIGYTRFVGSNLLRQQHFDDCYNSANIDTIDGKSFNMVVCAGVPAEKWIANREPIKDRQNIQQLTRHMQTIEADKFVLINAYGHRINIHCRDEYKLVGLDGLHMPG